MISPETPLLPFESKLAGRKVMVTGHTGFTGGWLCAWLNEIGCTVAGIGLEPNTEPSLYASAALGGSVQSHIADIRQYAPVRDVIAAVKPEIIFHLAAQPLVSRSYDDPLESFAVNALGTAHVLEAARLTDSVKGVVCITTDKVYADQEWVWGYRETDRLGGKDPYSASKACAELVAACYRQTMAARGNGLGIAVARGGNIIGGGDWSRDRIVPDFFRSLAQQAPLTLRNPDAVRPWQHVLALVHGYMLLAAGLVSGDMGCAAEFNFGPSDAEVKSVRALVEALCAEWDSPDIRFGTPAFIETKFLQVDSAKARRTLGWRPPLAFEDTVQLTAQWYAGYLNAPGSARALTDMQIAGYRRMLAG